VLRKIFKTGNSLVVSLPRDMLEHLGIAVGADVSVELDSSKSAIIIRPTHPALAECLDIDFVRQVNDFIKEYRPALEALAHK